MTNYYTLFPTPVPRRILVIGGGPCGLVTLRNLIEHGKFEHVELYERRDNVGGVWYFDDTNISAKSDHHLPRWPSPAYEGLIGNVLPEFLSFSGSPFPEPPSTPHQPFPTLKETHEYLRNFAAPYLTTGAIKLNREVLRVTELGNEEGWSVISRNWTPGANGKETEEIWDAIVIAVGWYDNQVWPNTPGLEELKNLGLAKHAKWWRGPKGYEGKKMLVIGNANSGNDISSQLTKVAQLPVYQSIRRPAFSNYPSLEDQRISKVAPVSKYIVKDDTPLSQKFGALLTDDTLLKDLDFVQVGTGYRPFPSFVHVFGHTPEDEGKIIPLVTENTTPNRIPSLHRLILYAHNPTLASVGTTLSYTPFTIADISSLWLALAWTGEVSYPDTPLGRLHFEKERLETIEKRRQATNCPSSLMVYNILGQDEQEYARSLRDDIVKARPDLGKILPLWNDERTTHREAMYKKKYDALSYSRSLPRSTI